MAERTGWLEVVERTRGNYKLLLGTLLAVFAISPFVDQGGWFRWALTLVTLAMVVSALLACWRRSTVFLFVIVFAASSQILSAVDRTTALAYSDVGSDALRFGFLLLVTGTIFSDVLRSRRVSMNTVLGASCVYLLMSLTWAAVYGALERIRPGSFVFGGEALSFGGTESLSASLVYFSLITLTTVGYGDITPAGPEARVLCGLEGLIGQLFVAIIIARLVALEIAERMGRSG